uniref:SERTA domain-containing protein n=1 Tax=Latimeria chalumnae TaxID=7897 RepID=H3BFJ2_LATCH
DTSTTSKVAYFKRKYAEEEAICKVYHGYFPEHVILPEDRTCILRLSLEKLRFLEDPEMYLRRSVLINNLLKKIHLETEREDDYEYFQETSNHRAVYCDTRKRFKLLMHNRFSNSVYYEDLRSYSVVPYTSGTAVFGLNYSTSHREHCTSSLQYIAN